MMKLILWLGMIWMPAMMYYMNTNETKFKKNIVLGVTLPQQAHEDPDILSVLDRYKKESMAVCVILTSLCVAGIFLPSRSTMAVWMLWVDCCVILPYLPYISSNRKLREYKTEKGWSPQKNTIHVDTAAVTPVRHISTWLFVPPIILCLVPVFFDPSMTMFYLLSACMCVLCAVSCRFLYRNKAEMIDSDTELTKVLSRIRVFNWGKMWLICSWFMAVFSVVSYLSIHHPAICFTCMIILTVVVCYEAVHLEMKTRKLQEKLTAQSGSEWYVDEDDHWIAGLFYCNPNDERTIINHRIGLNTTVNLARPAGKILVGFAAVLLVLMPFVGIWMDNMDEKEIELRVADGTVQVQCGMMKHTVETESIEEIQLLEELPEHLSRRVGTGLEHLIEGSFSSELGNLTVLADPTVSPYILIEDIDGKKYLFASRDPSNTRMIYEQLKTLP